MWRALLTQQHDATSGGKLTSHHCRNYQKLCGKTIVSSNCWNSIMSLSEFSSEVTLCQQWFFKLIFLLLAGEVAVGSDVASGRSLIIVRLLAALPSIKWWIIITFKTTDMDSLNRTKEKTELPNYTDVALLISLIMLL